MSLKEEISPEIIANSISMDSIEGYYVLVEGEKDFLFYSKFLNKELCSIEISQGKKNVIDTIKILNHRNINSKYFGIVDTDFDFLFDIPLVENIIKTDANSLETMCLYSDSFADFVREYFDENKLTEQSFVNTNLLRDHILNLTKPLSHLRILSQCNNYNFQFKPNKEQTKEIDYTKFICKNSFQFLGIDTLLETIKKYRNQGVQYSNEELKKQMKKTNIDQYNLFQLSHGHDISNVIVVAMKKVLGKNSLSQVKTQEIERAMRLVYTKNDFSKTQMKNEIEKIDPNIIL